MSKPMSRDDAESYINVGVYAFKMSYAEMIAQIKPAFTGKRKGGERNVRRGEAAS